VSSFWSVSACCKFKLCSRSCCTVVCIIEPHFSRNGRLQPQEIVFPPYHLAFLVAERPDDSQRSTRSRSRIMRIFCGRSRPNQGRLKRTIESHVDHVWPPLHLSAHSPKLSQQQLSNTEKDSRYTRRSFLASVELQRKR